MSDRPDPRPASEEVVVDWQLETSTRIAAEFGDRYIDGFDPNRPVEVEIVKGAAHGVELGGEQHSFPNHEAAWAFAKKRAAELEADGWTLNWNPSADPRAVDASDDEDWERSVEQLESWVWSARKRMRDEMTPMSPRDDGSIPGHYDDRDDWQYFHIFDGGE